MRPRVVTLWALPLLLACSESGGIVEVAWQFDDASLERVFPQGSRSDTCAFASPGVNFDLAVRLRVLANSEACAADPDAEDCEEIAAQTFPCYRFRGTADPVAVSAQADGTDDGYLMLIEALIDPTDTPPFVPNTDCIKGPGPRVRAVLPGRITDLEVQQFIIDEPGLLTGSTELEQCRE